MTAKEVALEITREGYLLNDRIFTKLSFGVEAEVQRAKLQLCNHSRSSPIRALAGQLDVLIPTGLSLDETKFWEALFESASHLESGSTTRVLW